MAYPFLGNHGGKVQTMGKIITRDDTRWANIKYFEPEEPGMSCRCCGECNMDYSFMLTMDQMRDRSGFPFPVISGYRCRKYDAEIGGAEVHPEGCALDLGLYGQRADYVLSLAYEPGSPIKGKGIHQDGPWSARFIHLDTMTSEAHPRPITWTYTKVSAALWNNPSAS